MEHDVIFISGPVRISILKYKDINFYIFGDSHGSATIGDCESQNIDNYWTIGKLLEEWFLYNYNNRIQTDFYLEIPFLKYNTHDKNIGTSKGWIGILSRLSQPCFSKDKTICKYYPYVRFHYANIRRVDDTGDINIFRTKIPIEKLLSFISNVLDYNTDLNNLNNSLRTMLYDLVMLSRLLYENLEEIFANVYMGNTDLSLVINSYRFTEYIRPDGLIGNIYNKTLNDILDKLSVNNANTDYITLHRTANEFYRLSKNYPEIAYKLKLFIGDALSFFKQRYVDVWEQLIEEMITGFTSIVYVDKEHTLMKYSKILHDKALRINRIFVTLGTLDVDTYVISRMFLQADTKQVFAYLGSNHAYNYMFFISNYLNAEVLYSNSYSKNNRCIAVPRTLLSLPI